MSRFDRVSIHTQRTGFDRTIPRVSIVTLNKDDSEALEATLRSVHSQTIPVFQHLVVDSSSGRQRIEAIMLAKTYGATIEWLAPSGIYPAMMYGFQRVMSGSDYNLFLNSEDTFFENESLETLLNVCASGDHWAVGGVRLVQQDGNFKDYFTTEQPRVTVSNLRSEMRWFPHPSTLYRSSSLAEVGPFTDNMSVAADYATNLRMFFRYGSPQIVHQVTAKHYVGGISSRQKLRSRIESTSARIEQFGVFQIFRDLSYYVGKLAALLKHSL